MTKGLGVPLARYAGAERTTFIVPSPRRRQAKRTEWTNHEVIRLRELIAEKLSASQAAGILRRSRNSCIGQAYRMGLAFKSRGRK